MLCQSKVLQFYRVYTNYDNDDENYYENYDNHNEDHNDGGDEDDDDDDHTDDDDDVNKYSVRVNSWENKQKERRLISLKSKCRQKTLDKQTMFACQVFFSVHIIWN